ncbi:McrB family protein [Glycomyces xiaoerkulensis]|uniref:McrB family protein n=1 Tax=Glycomyces xiaoerkulensis TaxID=2038139 RepID=UPI0018E407D9|nr:AAA family ATPase [Glycomyces xiaoerkulensis]
MIDPSTSEVLIPARDDDGIRAVGREYIDLGFGEGTSLFDRGRPLWNAETVGELHRCYNLRPDEGSDKFHEKLERQLADASDDAKLLMAELLALQSLPLLKGNLRPSSKIERVERVLHWMRKRVEIPDHVLDAFHEGTWNGGTGAHTMLWKWLFDAVELLTSWFRLPEDERSRIIADPWAWRDWVRTAGGMASMTEALLYLAFPGYFLPIVNVEHKRRIRAAFGHLLPHGEATGDPDRDLFEITLRLQRQHGDRIDLYKRPFRDEWRTAIRPGDEQRAWFLRPPQGGETGPSPWTDQGSITFPGARLGPLPQTMDRAVIRSAVESGYGHLDYADRLALTTEIHSFWSLIQPDDLVVTVVDDRLWAGVVKSEPTLGTEPGAELHREVDWYNERPMALANAPQSLRAALQRSDRIVDISGELKELSQLIGLEADSTEEARQTPPVVDPLDPARLQRLSERIHYDPDWLGDLVSLVKSRKQIVLYGPPGTGKTYLAQELAAHLTDRDAVELVQFHSSYSYEDFFEGFRPTPAKDGSVGFELRPGPLRDLARKAHNDPRPHVLIIDEMNRADLSRVFGELYFLLEYRERSVRLQYSPGESFSLPENVYLIGTMNTADRSIALLDAAIRRRFAFEEMHPEEWPVRDLLTRSLGGDATDDPRPALLRALNEAIPESDRDFKIGPSYLMGSEAETDAGLARIWRHDLLPLLEEHFHGRLGRTEINDRFGLDAVRRATGAAANPDADREQNAT